MNLYPSHIPFSQLVDWVENDLLAEERALVEQHLAACSICSEELVKVERLLGLMRADQAFAPPPALIRRAVAIFQPRTDSAAPSLLQRLVAALQFDSAQHLPALGLRAASPTPRQLLYSAGDYDLDLRLTPHDDGWTLSGQVLGHRVPVGHVVVQGELAQVQAPLAAPGEFVLPPIPAGAYTLIVSLRNDEITVESLKVGS